MMKGKLIVEFNLTVFLQLYAKQNKTLFMTSSKNTTWWILRQVLLHHASKLYFTLACRKCIDLYRRETGKDFVCLCTVDQNCKTGLHTITVIAASWHIHTKALMFFFFNFLLGCELNMFKSTANVLVWVVWIKSACFVH